MPEKKVNVRQTRHFIVEGELRDEHRRAGYQSGKPPGPDMVNRQIESHEHRIHFGPEDAEVCIRVQPGEGLGEIHVNLQWEGSVPKEGASDEEKAAIYNRCIANQRTALADAAEELRSFLEKFAVDWEIDVMASPCPKATQPLDLTEVVSILETGSRTVDPDVEVGPGPGPGPVRER